MAVTDDLELQLLRIAEHADCDLERQVYADMLKEAGKSQGEFIELQMLSSPTERQRARMNSLQETHQREWLSELVQYVDWGRGPWDTVFCNGRSNSYDVQIKFKRGLLSECPLSDDLSVAELDRALSHSLLKTVETLKVGKLSDLAAVSNLKNLRRLHISSGRTDDKALSDLTPISGLKDLESLCVTDSAIEDLGPISGLSNLVRLEIEFACVKDLSSIAALKKLRTVAFTANPLRDMEPLRAVIES